MPNRPTRSPLFTKPCSMAVAAVSGTETVPMFPSFSKVEKSRAASTPSAFSTSRRWPAPTWWPMTRSTSSPPPLGRGEEALPGLRAELDAVLEHLRRVGVHHVRRLAEQALRRAPAAEAVPLGRRARRARDQPVLGARVVLGGEQHRRRARAAGQRGDAQAIALQGGLGVQARDAGVDDLARALRRHHEPGADLPELDAVGDLHHAVEHAEARVGEIEDLRVRARRRGSPPPRTPSPARDRRGRRRRRSPRPASEAGTPVASRAFCAAFAAACAMRWPFGQKRRSRMPVSISTCPRSRCSAWYIGARRASSAAVVTRSSGSSVVMASTCTRLQRITAPPEPGAARSPSSRR